MNKLDVFLIGVGTCFLGYFLTIIYIPIQDVYLQSIESVRLAILFLAGVISMWGYLILQELKNKNNQTKV